MGLLIINKQSYLLKSEATLWNLHPSRLIIYYWSLFANYLDKNVILKKEEAKNKNNSHILLLLIDLIVIFTGPLEGESAHEISC